MNLSCSSRAIKYLMFMFNFFFVITGIILIAVGATIKANYIEYETFLDEKYFSLPNLLIATGVLIFVISFLGCYGAIKESWIILMAFSVLLGVIFIFEFSAGIAGYVLRDKTSTYLEKTFYESMQNYNNTYPVAKMWDLIQAEFECCGVRSPSDWSGYYKHELPISCCPKKFGAIGDFHCNTQSTTISTVTASPSTSVRRKRQVTDGEGTTKTNVSSTATPISTSSVTTASSTTPTSAAPTSTPATSPTTKPVTEDPISTTSPYQKGCEQAFGDFVREHAVKIGVVGFVLAILQIIGVGVSCHLSLQLKNQYYST